VFRRFFCLLSAILLWTINDNAAAVGALLPTTTTTVKNLRPIIPGCAIYRSATLDDLSNKDAELLLNGILFDDDNDDDCHKRPLAAVIDLRNSDEVAKGAKKRTSGSNLFYSSASSMSSDDTVNFLHCPILKDIDSFWDEAINQLDTSTKVAATLQTVFQGGALDRAAARNLEQGGHALMYSIMLKTAKQPIADALNACLQESKRGPVIFHCQKGKDRTGLIAMLLQHLLGHDDQQIVNDYAVSEKLLGPEEMEKVETQAQNNNNGGGTMIDWGYFRGSPASAMVDTLEWTRQTYGGSLDGYLNSLSSLDKQELTMFQERYQLQEQRMK